jgi:hypothetical protein
VNHAEYKERRDGSNRQQTGNSSNPLIPPLSHDAGIAPRGGKIRRCVGAAFQTFHILVFRSSITVSLTPTIAGSPAHGEAAFPVRNWVSMLVFLRQLLQMAAKAPAKPIFRKAATTFRAALIG